jgi:outer membrane lipoprotein-sorting protein
VLENVTVPDKITLTAGDDENPHLTIRYSDAQRTTSADAASFDLQPPPNAATIVMD